MSRIQNFQDLIIWQRSHALALEVYKATHSFPASEQFGLTSQLRRAVVSVPSNIAEGFGRDTNKEFYHFLIIARGSLAEVQAQLLLGKDLNYIPLGDHDSLAAEIVEIQKMLNKFMSNLKSPRLTNLPTNGLGD